MFDKLIMTVYSDEWLKMFINDLVAADHKKDLEIHRHECLFIPYVGSKYRNAKTRILFIGRETNGHGEIFCSNCGTQLKKTDQNSDGAYICPKCHRKVLNILSDVVEDRDNSQLHQLLVNCTIDLTDKKIIPTINKGDQLWKMRHRIAIGLGESLQAIAWSNIFKVSRLKKEPTRHMKEFLSMSDINTLRREIISLEPDVIIFNLKKTPWSPGGNPYDKYIYDTFSKMVTVGPTPVSDMVSRLYGVNDKSIVIRTPHPANNAWPNWKNEVPSLVEYVRQEVLQSRKKKNI